MRKGVFQHKLLAVALATMLLTNGCVSGRVYEKESRESEFEEAASEYVELIQDGDHGSFSDEPFTSDFQGIYSNGLYTNEDIGFNVVIPEGFEPLSVADFKDYISCSDRLIFVCDPDDDMNLLLGYCSDYRFGNAEGDSITFYYTISCLGPAGFLRDAILGAFEPDFNVFLQDAHPGATITSNSPELIEINNQLKYMITYEIDTGDSITYRTDIIDLIVHSDDFINSFSRIVSIEYTDPQDLDEIMQGITYTIPGDYPNADDLELMEQ